MDQSGYSKRANEFSGSATDAGFLDKLSIIILQGLCHGVTVITTAIEQAGSL